MTIEQAFHLVNNLDWKETHRPWAPQHGLLQFNKHGEIVNVDRFKKSPDKTQQYEALCKQPGCLQIFTTPHSFATPQDLKKRIDEDLWLFAHFKPQPGGQEE